MGLRGYKTLRCRMRRDKQMHYFFLDESYPPAASGQKTIVMAAWAVEQHRWGHDTAGRFDLFKPPLLKRVCSMIESLDGAALVAKATLDDSEVPVGQSLDIHVNRCAFDLHFWAADDMDFLLPDCKRLQ